MVRSCVRSNEPDRESDLVLRNAMLFVQNATFFKQTCLFFSILVQAGDEVICMLGWGLGKKRSKLGQWLDRRGITQQWLSRETDLNRATISRIASDDEYTPNLRSVQKILKALRKVDPTVKQEDFWSV